MKRVFFINRDISEKSALSSTGSYVTTPNTLNKAQNSTQILDALRTAVANLDSAGIGLNAAMGNIQFTRKGDTLSTAVPRKTGL